MQDQREGKLAAQPAGIGTELDQRGRGCGKQEVGNNAQVTTGQAIENMRKGKDQVGVRHRQEFPVSRLRPLFLGPALAFGTVPVAAGMIDIPGGVAGIALLDMAAQRFGATGDDGAPCLGLARGERVLGKVGLPVLAEEVGQLNPAAVGHGLALGAQCREQVQGGIGGRDLLLHMQVAGGGGDIVVPQQAADRVNIDAGFEQVGSKGMAQAVDAALLGHAGAALGSLEHLLHLRDIDGLFAIRLGKQPMHWTSRTPVKP